jgi:hypothetical protein
MMTGLTCQSINDQDGAQGAFGEMVNPNTVRKN